MKYQIGEVVRVRETGALVTVIEIDDDGLPIVYLTVADDGSARYKESSLEPVNGGVKQDFLTDKEKMYDFLRLSKVEFLDSYSYLTNAEYDATDAIYNTLFRLTKQYEREEESTADLVTAKRFIRHLNEDDYLALIQSMFRGMSLDDIETGVKSLCDPDFDCVYDTLTEEYKRRHAEEPAKESDSDSMTFEQFLNHIRSVDEAIFEQCYRAMEEEDRRRDQEQQRQLAGAIASAMDAYLRKVGDNRDFYSRGGEYMSMQDMYDAIVNEFDLTAQ